MQVGKEVLTISVELERVLERMDQLPIDRNQTEVRAARRVIIERIQVTSAVGRWLRVLARSACCLVVRRVRCRRTRFWLCVRALYHPPG